ncbi:hypothetical protein [Cellulomonas fimi]|uniref:hypothetical protein n=1 Tax=Cellulomonas fimi TaxID=1708 RepID=UPI002359A751|nr:hypothetical protein [Cellulomonas fimi]
MRRDLPRAVGRTSRAAPAAAAARPRPRAVDGLPALQRAAGNRAVAGLLAARSGATVVQRYETEEHATLGAPGTRVTVAGIDMTQGEMITMGDFFTGVDQMEAHPQQVRDVLAAIRRGGAGTADWQRATGGRYLELATANQAHFGPPNAALVPVSGTSTADHRAAFVAGHSRALWESALGHPDVAQRHNSFAGHFLTDAFAAGHVVNKADVMARFAARLTDADAFLSAVAARAWAIPGVVATMSRYEENSTPLHLDFDTQGMFERFLKGVSEAKPELVPNSIAKVVHDVLNGLAGDASVGGLDVANDRGDTWRLSGDGTLARSPDTQRIAAAAVAQSNANLAAVAGTGAPAMTPERTDALVASVWTFVPHPTAAGTAQIDAIVGRLTDPANAALVDAFAQLIAGNLDAIVEGATALGKIRPIPPSLLEEAQRGWQRLNDWRTWAGAAGVQVP